MHAIQNMILKSNAFHEKALPKAQQTSLYFLGFTFAAYFSYNYCFISIYTFILIYDFNSCFIECKVSIFACYRF